MAEPVTKAEVLEAAARGEGCLGRAADDEPVFVLVAHDAIAAQTVLDWVVEARRAGVSADKCASALDVVRKMMLHCACVGRKVPD